jgi:hypothetical protein
MTKCLLYVAPIALVGLMAAEASAAPAAWSGSIARDIAAATAEGTDAPLVLVRGGGGRGGGGGFRGGAGGGGFRGGAGGVAGGHRGGFSGGGFNRAGAGVGAGNLNRGNFNRNVNVVGGGGYRGGYGGGYYGSGWGGVAAGVTGAAIGAAAASTSYYYPTTSAYCPYPSYPNCGL